jgi:nitroreductase
VVIAGRSAVTTNDVSSFVASIADTRGVPSETLSDYQGMIQSFVEAQTPDQHKAWIAKQCYIALGFFLETAALLGIDTCPMEGFIPSEYDRLLGLSDQGYTSVVVAAAGYRSDSDHHATAKKVRFAAQSLFQYYR